MLETYPRVFKPVALSLVSSTQVVSYPTKADFPNPGELNVIYIAADTDTAYIWDDTTTDYIQINSVIPVIDNLTSTSTTSALSANMGRELEQTKEVKLAFSTGLERVTNTITTKDSEIDHNSLSNYASNRHFLQSDITNISPAISGIVISSAGVLGSTANNSAQWDTAYAHTSSANNPHNVTLEQARAQNFTINGSINFNRNQALALVCHNDLIQNTPKTGLEKDGQWFYANDIKVLYLYEGSWMPIISFGNLELYVDTINGSDAAGKGFASGAGACKTIQCAISRIPALIGGNVTINIASGTYNEDIVLQGKNFAVEGEIKLLGDTLNSVDSGSVGGTSTQGSWTNNTGTIVDVSKSWTVDEHRGKLVYNSGTGEYIPIKSNTATTLTIVGQFSGTPSGTYNIYEQTTIINPNTEAFKIQGGQKSVRIENIKFTNSNALNQTININDYCQVKFYYCNVGGKTGIVAFGSTMELWYTSVMTQNSGIICYGGSYQGFRYVLIVSVSGGTPVNGNAIWFTWFDFFKGTHIEGWNRGCWVKSGGTAAVSQTAIENNTTGILNDNSNYIPAGGGSAPYFSGNTTDVEDSFTKYSFVNLYGISLTPQSSAPASPGAGDVYFDSTLNKHRGYDGTSWNNFY